MYFCNRHPCVGTKKRDDVCGEDLVVSLVSPSLSNAGKELAAAGDKPG